MRTRCIGKTDLICRDGNWFLHATIEAPEAPLTEPTNGFLGVDMCIVGWGEVMRPHAAPTLTAS